MSTVAEVVDVERLQEGLAAVRADGEGVARRAWVLVGHVNNDPNKVDVLDADSSEEATLEAFLSKLEEDQVMYGLLRLTTSVDMSTTVKFVYVHWVGEKVPFARKGRFGVVHGSVEEHFNPYHLLLETATTDDLQEDVLIAKLEDSMGTTNKVIEGSIEGRQVRGFTQHAVKQQNKGHLRSIAPEGSAVEVSPELQEAIGEVRSDSCSTSWVLATFEEANLKKPLIIHEKGEGSIDELRDNLSDDLVMYGLYRTTDKYDDITTVKFVYIYWVGDGVKPLTKGRVSTVAGPIEKVFSPIHVTFSLTSQDKDDISQDMIIDKVMASSGSKSFVK